MLPSLVRSGAKAAQEFTKKQAGGAARSFSSKIVEGSDDTQLQVLNAWMGSDSASSAQALSLQRQISSQYSKSVDSWGKESDNQSFKIQNINYLTNQIGEIVKNSESGKIVSQIQEDLIDMGFNSQLSKTAAKVICLAAKKELALAVLKQDLHPIERRAIENPFKSNFAKDVEEIKDGGYHIPNLENSLLNKSDNFGRTLNKTKLALVESVRSNIYGHNNIDLNMNSPLGIFADVSATQRLVSDIDDALCPQILKEKLDAISKDKGVSR